MSMCVVDLRAEATAESVRIERAREWMRAGDAPVLARLESDGPWILRARRRETRAALSGRMVLVWRIAYEDARGRLLASTLVAVAITGPVMQRCRRSRSAFRDAVVALQPVLAERVEAHCAGWRQTAAHAIRAAHHTGMARATAMAAGGGTTGAGAYQPGLFDRRAERSRISVSASDKDRERAAAERLAAMSVAALPCARAPQLLLVIA
jgi:hypothetical protein